MLQEFLKNHSSEGLIKARLDGTIYEVSETCPSLIGLTIEELLDMNLVELVSARDRGVAFDQIEHLRSTGESVLFECRLISNFGMPPSVEVYGVRDGVTIVLLLKEVTLQKVTEVQANSLLSLVQRYKVLFATVSQASQTTFTLYSPNLESLFNQTVSEDLESDCQCWTQLDDYSGENVNIQKQLKRGIKKVFQSKQPFSLDLSLHSDEAPCYVQGLFTPVLDSQGSVESVWGIYTNTTQRIREREGTLEAVAQLSLESQTRNELKHLRRRLDSADVSTAAQQIATSAINILKAERVEVWQIDKETQTAERLAPFTPGRSRSKLSMKLNQMQALLDLLESEDLYFSSNIQEDIRYRRMSRLFSFEEFKSVIIVPIFQDSNLLGWVKFNFKKEIELTPVIENFVTSLTDLLLLRITFQRKLQVEQNLAAAELRLSRLNDLSSNIHALVDVDSYLISINARWVNTLGYSEDEVVGRSIYDFMTPSSAELVSSRLFSETAVESEIEQIELFTAQDHVLTFSLNFSEFEEAGHPRAILILKALNRLQEAVSLPDEIGQKVADIQHSQLMLEGAVRLTPNAVAIVNHSNQTYELVSERFAEMLDYFSHELDGGTVLYTRGEDTLLSLVDLPSASGELLRVNFSEIFWEDEKGEAYSIQTIRDASNSLAGEYLIKQLSQLFLEFPEPIAILVNSEFKKVNIEFTRLTGYCLEEIAEGGLALLQGSDTNLVDLAAIEGAISKKFPYKAEIALYSKAQKRLWISVNVFVLEIENGEPEIALVLTNIAGMRERLSALEKALLQEQQASSIRAQLIQSINQQASNPLSAISTSIKLMELAPERAPTYLKMIDQAAGELNSLLESILIFSALSGASVAYSPVNLGALYRQLKVELEAKLENKRLTFIAEDLEGEPITVFADESLLHLILKNLLINSIDYSSPNSEIRLQVQLNESELILKLEDQGSGIASEDLASIYQPFYRGKNALSYKGIGLGLSIVEKAVNLSQGTIQVESSEGEGTTFTVILPINE